MLIMPVYIFVLGAILGSAANALIDRLPRRISWTSGRSKCDTCGHLLQWYDLLPVVSYLFLLLSPASHGKHKNMRTRNSFYTAGCRYCGAAIPVRNLIVEVLMGLGFVMINVNQISVGNIILSLILWVTIIVAVMDWETKLVSDVMVLIWSGLVMCHGWWLGEWGLNIIPGNQIAGAALGVGLIGGIWLVTKGKAMGDGDIEIAAVMGWWLLWQRLLVGLWLAFVMGSIVGVIKIMNKKATMKSEMAFGPFLILGSWIALIWGEKIWAIAGMR